MARQSACSERSTRASVLPTSSSEAGPSTSRSGRAALQQLAAVPRYAERSAHQPIQRSLAFTLPLRIKAGQVQAILGAQASVQVTDLFRHVEEGEPVRTVTFQLVFDNPTGSTTAEQVNQRCEGLIAQVTGELGERGVRLRG